MTQRYSSEFLPFLIFGYSTFLARLRLPAARRARIIAAAAFTGICVFCVFVNILSSLSWTAVYNWAAASDERRVVQDLVREMDGWF
jgi:hypothetical protein